jgi:DNA polymerase-3 subunit alpha
MRDFFELQDENLWMKSEEELNEKWLSDYSDIIPYEVFCEAKKNTVEICRKAKGVELDRSLKLPIFPDCDERLKDQVIDGFKKRNLPKTREYLDRIKEELGLITRKGFSTYFLIQKMMTDEARRWCRENIGGDGTQAVGPGRGSACGSLICYCLGITDVDPVYEGLLFSRFMSEARGGRSINFDFK